mmetsp:Transcript_11140/g.35344  ORF Transcript_11140/g.35344 Transcript_11140/m.35344 type:complete len:543 (-) Transcript_11140:10-1638(-)
MMKNMMDLFVGCLAFYLFGFKIAYGHHAVSLEEEGFDWAMWFLQFSYATTAATIDSGALAGRVSFFAYIILSLMVTGVIYPLVVQWVWGEGWLQELGFEDFAGGAVVHCVGAVSALVSICVCGPRIGRFPAYRAWRGAFRVICLERNDDDFYRGPMTEVETRVYSPVSPIHNPVQALFGVFLLLTGFLAFNPASTFSTTSGSDLMAARASVTTLLATTGAALTAFPLAALRRRSLVITIPEFATVTVAGMVASCGCCHVVPPLLAPVLGSLAAVLADRTSAILIRLQLDDVVGAVAAHGPPGVLGVLCVPLLAKPHCQSDAKGVVFGGGKEAWEKLGTQAYGIAAIMAFTAATTYLVVIAIDLLVSFRSNRATELIGHDFMEHAYEDGSTMADLNRAMVIRHSPVRDCMKERIRTSVHSPGKDYREEGASEPEPGADDAARESHADALESGGSTADIAALEREVRRLREDMHLLTAMLSRTQVNNNIFSSGASGGRQWGATPSVTDEDRRAILEEQATGPRQDSRLGLPAEGEAAQTPSVDI